LDSTPSFPQRAKAPAGAPNVVVFLLDDVGFGQTSPFGGPVKTATLEALAERGLRYTRFHTTAMCSPTRAALLTGKNHHAVAHGCISEYATGFPGYHTLLPASSATIAEILRGNGYATAAFGKWHNTPEWETGPAGPYDQWPNRLGFDYFYGFIGADCDQYAPTLYRNTTLVDPPRSPEQGYILDADLADEAVAWLHKQQDVAKDRPFFMWYASGTAHSPLHAPADWIRRYRGVFDHGWDRQRELTLQRQIAAKIAPEDTVLTPRPDGVPAWDSLSVQERQLYARYQEVFAGAVSHCDHQIGRVVQALEETGARDNTLILFIVGDNGPSAEGGLKGTFNKFANINGITEPPEQVMQRIEEIGGPSSYANYPTGWGWAGSAPFQWFKQLASHLGGTRNGMVVSWPTGGAHSGELRGQFHHCVDIAPTILEATGIAKPSVINGVTQAEFDGVSMCYSFAQPQAGSPRRRQYFEMFGNRAIYSDGWMASARHGPLPWEYSGGKLGGFEEDRWELYNLEQDFSQGRDLAGEEQERLRSLQQAWTAEAARNLVFPLDDRRAVRMGSAAAQLTAASSTRFVYRSQGLRLPEGIAPRVRGRSHRVTCELDYRTGQEGVLLAAGGRFGGYSFFILGNRLRYAHNLCATEVFDAASEPLPAVASQLSFEFRVHEPVLGAGGVVEFRCDGRLIGGGCIQRTVPLRYSWAETFDIGRDTGTPVSPQYASPFPYQGVIRSLEVEILSELAPQQLAREEQEMQRAAFNNE
jgi:arylsulfatase